MAAVTLMNNADDQRVEKESAAGTKKFLYDYQMVLQEVVYAQMLYAASSEIFGNLISEYGGADSRCIQFVN